MNDSERNKIVIGDISYGWIQSAAMVESAKQYIKDGLVFTVNKRPEVEVKRDEHEKTRLYVENFRQLLMAHFNDALVIITNRVELLDHKDLDDVPHKIWISGNTLEHRKRVVEGRRAKFEFIENEEDKKRQRFLAYMALDNQRGNLWNKADIIGIGKDDPEEVKYMFQLFAKDFYREIAKNT